MTGAPTTVWLASFPKSGNTWFRAVLAAVRTGDPFDLQSSGLGAAGREAIDQALGISSTDLTAAEVATLRPLADEWCAAAHAADTPLVRKIHDGLRTGPGGSLIVAAEVTRCAIYIVRDPRDVAVSFAHHNGRDVAWAVDRLCEPPPRAALDDVSRQVRQVFGTWSDHVRSWLDDVPFPVTVVRYEDCLVEPVATFGAALEFAGIGVSPGDLSRAVAAARFELLQAREAADGFAEVMNRRSPFFRRGRTGAWHDELPPALARRIEDEHADVMHRLGYGSESGGDRSDADSAATSSIASSSASSAAGA